MRLSTGRKAEKLIIQKVSRDLLSAGLILHCCNTHRCACVSHVLYIILYDTGYSLYVSCCNNPGGLRGERQGLACVG